MRLLYVILIASFLFAVSCKSTKPLTKQELKEQQEKDRNRRIKEKNKETKKKNGKLKRKGINGQKNMIYGM